MRFFKDFVNEVDGHGGKHSFDNTCNVRKKYLFIKKKKKNISNYSETTNM
jgi:hypothetical protein